MEFKGDDEAVQYYSIRCKSAEKKIEELNDILHILKSEDAEAILEMETINDREFAASVAENKKLKYRINILKKNIETLENGSSDASLESEDSKFLPPLLQTLENAFNTAVNRVCPKFQQDSMFINISKVADYQCNIALPLSKKLGKNPRELSQEIIAQMPPTSLIAKLEMSGPGFINIYISKDYIQKQIMNLLCANEVRLPPEEHHNVIVDFSSPNIAKEMHVGHLRSTIIGESICRLLEHTGHNVKRLNHLGDWGTQFGMLLAHLSDKFHNILNEPPSIANLQSFYKESKKRFDEEPDFKKRAYEAVVNLQAFEAKHYEGWKQICNISMAEFNKVYERLNVRIEPRGESYYQKRMERLVQDLDARGMLELEKGRKVMYAEGADIPLTVVKSDGGFTYDTSDMACIRSRIEEDRAQRIIYVTDAGQAQHFKSILACAQKAGIYDPKKVKIDHVTFGVVLGEDKKKFRTRSGDTVRLIDLLDEGLERALAKLQEKERHKVLNEEELTEAQIAVAYGCVKYADLCHDRTRDYIFSFDRMLDFRGNTAAYLLYALTRIRSIVRTANVTSKELIDWSLSASFSLEHEKEWKLAKTLLKASDVLCKATMNLYLHPICEFIYEVSCVYTEFYDNCYCIEKDSNGVIVKINHSRLVLCEATAVVMETCLNLLGIKTLHKM